MSPLASSRPVPEWLSPSDLLLDPTNPRLAGHHFTLHDQTGILDWLWKNKSVEELVDSMLASGFWQHEELFATRETAGELVVVEGNRRLAAVKILTEPELRAKLRLREIPEPTPAVQASLEKLPVLIQSRREIWQFVGFKHVNGPQDWDSIAKAEYVYRVHQTFGIGLDEIARSIGDRHDTVRRLYSGYLVLKQAQDRGLFDPEDCVQKRFPFSHLWTALGYTSVRNFLGVDADSLQRPDPVPLANHEQLHNLMVWLFGSRTKELEPKVKRQNPDLRDLAQALENPKGVYTLRADLPLAMAKEASLGDERLFQNALVEAEKALRESKRFVATGYRGEPDLLKTATDIEALAKSLRREMAGVTRLEEADE